MHATSYWLEEPWPAFPVAAPLDEADVDVVVIGAGVTGCSCALTLAQGGLRVRLHDAGPVAGGASGRNGGFALRGGAMPYDEACTTLGRDRAQMLWKLSERALESMAGLAGDAFRRTGSLRLAVDDEERDAILREIEALAADGFATAWTEELPPPLDRLYRSAAINAGDGALQPARWVRRLATHASRAGAEIAEWSPLDPAEISRATVVVAVDGLTAALVPELAPFVRPVRGQMLVTTPVEPRGYDRPHYARHGFDYWQQLDDGRLVIGGRRDVSFETEYTASHETTTPVQASIEELAAELLGHPPVVTHRWSGIWGETTDRLPLAGRVPGRERLWVAGGYSGHGNALGFACGDLVARAILGERPPELALFDPARLFD